MICLVYAYSRVDIHRQPIKLDMMRQERRADIPFAFIGKAEREGALYTFGFEKHLTKFIHNIIIAP